MTDTRNIWDMEELPVDREPVSLAPDVCTETRRALVDMIRGDEASTVLGVLLESREPVSLEAIAGRLDRPVEEVSWTIEMLEAEELCSRVTRDDGLVKVFAFAPYTAANR